MFWLISLIGILQFGFHWILKPAIDLTTPIFEAHAIWVLSLFLGVYFFSGRSQFD